MPADVDNDVAALKRIVTCLRVAIPPSALYLPSTATPGRCVAGVPHTRFLETVRATPDAAFRSMSCIHHFLSTGECRDREAYTGELCFWSLINSGWLAHDPCNCKEEKEIRSNKDGGQAFHRERTVVCCWIHKIRGFPVRSPYLDHGNSTSEESAFWHRSNGATRYARRPTNEHWCRCGHLRDNDKSGICHPCSAEEWAAIALPINLLKNQQIPR